MKTKKLAAFFLMLFFFMSRISYTDVQQELDKLARRIAEIEKSSHYFSVGSTKTGEGSNYNNDGAKAEWWNDTDSIAIGWNAKLTQDVNNGIALGTNSIITRHGSVGLGSWTSSTRQGIIIENGKYSDHTSIVAPFSGQTLHFTDNLIDNEIHETEGKNSIIYGVVSVGGSFENEMGENIGFLRQIINVGDGTEETDAVNLRQLRAVEKKNTEIEKNVDNKVDLDLQNITSEGKALVNSLIEVEGSENIAVEEAIDESKQIKKFRISLEDNLVEKLGEIGKGSISETENRTVSGATVYRHLATEIPKAKISYRGEGEEEIRNTSLSEGFHFKGDDNIQVSTQENGEVHHRLSSELKGVQSISNGESKILLSSDPTLGKIVDVTSARIVNVADGTSDSDAVNLRQLRAVEKKNTEIEKNVDNKVDLDLQNITSEGKALVNSLIEVEGSENIAVEEAIDESKQIKKFRISLEDNLVEKLGEIGKGSISETESRTVSGATVYHHLSTEIPKAKISYRGEGEEEIRNTSLSEGFHFKGDDNIQVSTQENGEVHHHLSSELKGVQSISNGESKILLSSDTTLGKIVDVTSARIANVADGTSDSDAVNLGQLKKVENKLVSIENNLGGKLEERIEKKIEGKLDRDFNNLSKEGKEAITNLISLEGEGDIAVHSRIDEKSNQKIFTLSLKDELLERMNRETDILKQTMAWFLSICPRKEAEEVVRILSLI